MSTLIAKNVVEEYVNQPNIEWGDQKSFCLRGGFLGAFLTLATFRNALQQVAHSMFWAYHRLQISASLLSMVFSQLGNGSAAAVVQ